MAVMQDCPDVSRAVRKLLQVVRATFRRMERREEQMQAGESLSGWLQGSTTSPALRSRPRGRSSATYILQVHVWMQNE